VGFRLPKTRAMLRREAASWLARLQSGRDPDTERNFQRWRDADPRHTEAFERVRRSYEQAGLLRNSPTIVAAGHAPRIRTPEWRLPPALAAAAAILVLVPTGAFFIHGKLPLGGTDAVMLVTRVGEIRQVKLADGSTVTLDTSTKVDVEIGRSRRGAHLRYGRARFQIAPAEEPFVVETDSSTVTTGHGVIDVEQVGQQARVEVLAGAADVRSPGQQPASGLTLRAGESATANAGGPEQKAAVASASDWTRGMLQFDATPLADAVALANRYSERHILLGGGLDGLRVTGAFRAGDTVALAKALAAAFDLPLRQRPDGDLILSGSVSPALQHKRGG
jgi:transmembrane sensor